MKFKHYATGEIITVEKETDNVVFHKENNKYHKIIKDKEGRTALYKTSFIKIGN